MPNPIHSPVEAVSLITLAVAVFGPQAGPYVVIVLGSIGGGLWALSGTAFAPPPELMPDAARRWRRRQGLWLMVRCVITAIVLTALIAGLVGPFFGMAVTEAYAFVAFGIGAMGNRWQDVIESVKNRLQALISTAGGKQP